MFSSKKVFSTQNEAGEYLLSRNGGISMPDFKNFKWNGKDRIASHTKIISNVRKKLRKQGRDVVCYETHFMKGSRMIANHTRYEVTDRIYPKTKIISLQYI